jgi:hypothetical protein
VSYPIGGVIAKPLLIRGESIEGKAATEDSKVQSSKNCLGECKENISKGFRGPR